MSPPRLHGLGVSRSEFTPRRSVLAVDEHTTSGGNIIIRVGRENPLRGTGWTKTEHVVITPGELPQVIADLSAHL